MIDGATAIFDSRRHGHCIVSRIYPTDGSTGGPYYEVIWVQDGLVLPAMTADTFTIWAENQELEYERTFVSELKA